MTTAIGAANPPGETKLLDPSELGTQEYWEAAYARELKNNTDDADDEGIIWFDESNAEDTVLKLLNQYSKRGLLDRATCRFLDLGTGNGHMLFALSDHDDDEDNDDDDEEEADGNDSSPSWRGEMVGVDYSPASVKLARQIQAKRLASDADDDHNNDNDNEHDDSDSTTNIRRNPIIRFEQWDLLTEAPGPWLADGFDAVLDKGTFDAISLMPHERNTEQQQRQQPIEVHPCAVYRRKVVPLIKPGAVFIVTSCNWTASELTGWLAPAGGELEVFEEARYPTFTFGGKTGQSVVTVVFRRRNG